MYYFTQPLGLKRAKFSVYGHTAGGMNRGKLRARDVLFELVILIWGPLYRLGLRLFGEQAGISGGQYFEFVGFGEL